MPKVRKLLTDWDAPYIKALMRLIETQSKQTLANWAIDYSKQHLLPLWEKYYPTDNRPEISLDFARRWLSGEVKLKVSKKKRF